MIQIILGLVSDNWELIAGAFGVIAVWFAGSQSQKNKQATRKVKANDRTHERINKVTPVDPIDRSDIIDRLRDHGKR